MPEYSGCINSIPVEPISSPSIYPYAELIEEGDGFENDRDAYSMENVFFVPEEARWSTIASAAHTPEIGTVIDNTIYKTLKDYYHINALGYSTKNFQSSEAIVFVEKGSTHTITLTAYWTGHADVITKESDPSICDVTFAATSWERSVDVKIEGKKIGTTMVTFQNSSDNRSFSIAVVVVRP